MIGQAGISSDGNLERYNLYYTPEKKGALRVVLRHYGIKHDILNQTNMIQINTTHENIRIVIDDLRRVGFVSLGIDGNPLRSSD